MCEPSVRLPLLLMFAACAVIALYVYWPRKPKPPRTFTYQERDPCTGMMITKTAEYPEFVYLTR